MKRVIGLLDITMISVGAILASGIFLVPATIALHIQSPSLTLAECSAGCEASSSNSANVICATAAVP